MTHVYFQVMKPSTGLREQIIIIIKPQSLDSEVRVDGWVNKMYLTVFRSYFKMNQSHHCSNEFYGCTSVSEHNTVHTAATLSADSDCSQFSGTYSLLLAQFSLETTLDEHSL